MSGLDHSDKAIRIVHRQYSNQKPRITYEIEGVGWAKDKEYESLEEAMGEVFKYLMTNSPSGTITINKVERTKTYQYERWSPDFNFKTKEE